VIKHVVCWTFADTAEGRGKAENVDLVHAALTRCATLPGVTGFRLIRPQEGLEASFDLMLESEFTDVDALRAYATHPLHVEAGGLIAKTRTGRWAMDFDPDAV